MWSSILYESMCTGIQNESTYFLASPELFLSINRKKLPIEIYGLQERIFFIFLLLCCSECKIRSSRLKIKSLWIQNTSKKDQRWLKKSKSALSIWSLSVQVFLNRFVFHREITPVNILPFPDILETTCWFTNSSHYAYKFIIFLTTLDFSQIQSNSTRCWVFATHTNFSGD